MKADPEAQQPMPGVYNLEDAGGSNLTSLHIDYENLEESLRNMLSHNSQPSFNEKEDTSGQMHAYKNAIFKFPGHINYIERENHVLKRQTAGLSSQAMNGDSITHQQRSKSATAQGGMSQLEDIRSTCTMLSERIKRMEDQNHLLLTNADKQRCEYERCLQRVASHVFQTLSYQRRLQLECDALRMQLHHLTGSLPHSLPGSSRSSESSANGQSTRGSVSDGVFSQYGNFMQDSHLPPYSPTFATRGENIPGVVNHIPGVGQKIDGSVLFERRGQPYVNGHPYYQHLSGEAEQFNGHSTEPQYQRHALSSHRIQTAKTPPLHAIPETIEPTSASVQNLAEFRPRLPRSGSEIIAESSSLVSALGPQRAAFDDESVGYMSISRGRQRSTERSKVARSRSFDGHSSNGRTQPARPIQSMSPKRAETSALSSYRPGPPLYSVHVGRQVQRDMQNSTKDSLASRKMTSGPNASPVKHKDSVSFDQEMLQGDHRPPSTTVANTSPGIINNNPLSPTSHTASVSSLVTQHPRPTESQEPKSPTVREMNANPFTRECLQRSFRVTRSCERREQRKANDDVWLPRSGRSAEPTLRDPRLPPPPPPPPKDEIREEINEETKSEGIPTEREQKPQSENSDLSKRESYAAACGKSQSLGHLNQCWKNVAVEEKSPQTSPLQSNYAIFDEICSRSNTGKGDEIHEVVNLPPTIDQTTEDPKKYTPLNTPTQFQTPINQPIKKNTEREAPRPPTTTPTDNAISAQVITPAVSCEALSSPYQHTKVVPRRQSEGKTGMVRELDKKTKLSAPSQKRCGKGNQEAAEKPLTETQRRVMLSPKAGIAMTSSYITKNSLSNSVSPLRELSGKHHNPQTMRHPGIPNVPKYPELNTGRDHTYDKSNAYPSSSDAHQLRSHRAVSHTKVIKSIPDDKSSKQYLSSGVNPKELRAKDGIKNEKRSEPKKKSGNQKSFVHMMKSKFGGKGSASKKTSEVQESLTYVALNEVKSTSVIDPRTLSLEPNSLPPKNLGKKASKETGHDPVGRKLSRPFLRTPMEGHSSAAHQPLASETDFPARRGFLGRNHFKRSNNSRHGTFENADYFNNVPYGRVELIPIGSPILGAFQFDEGEKNIATSQIIAHEAKIQMSEDENVPAVNDKMILSPSKKCSEDFSQSKRQMNDYENVVLLSDIQKGSTASKDVTSRGYENVVIVKASERSGGPETDGNAKEEEADERPPATKMKPKDKGTVLKQGSPLQPIRSGLSNHSLNKMPGPDDGSSTTLHEIGGQCVPGQFTSEKKGDIYASEQQTFEKAFINSVVEAELNSKEKNGTNIEYIEEIADNPGNLHPMDDKSRSHPSIPDSSQTENEKSSMTFRLKSANSGFDSWPSKSTGTDLPSESARGGSLDAGFRDVKSIQEIEIVEQSFLQKRIMVDSHSSLGSFGYGSGVSGSSSTSSNKSRGRSQTSEEPTCSTRDFSSSDNDLTSTAQPNLLQSRYASRSCKFASIIGSDASGSKFHKAKGLHRPSVVRIKMGVSSISPPNTQIVRDCDNNQSSPQSEPMPKKLTPLTCGPPIAKKTAGLSQNSATKCKEQRKSGFPCRTNTGAIASTRFGVQRTSIPVRHSASRAQQHIG